MFVRSPIYGHPEGPWIAHYLRAYLLGDEVSSALLFGNRTDSLRNGVQGLVERNAGARNQGQKEVGFLACRAAGPAAPAGLARRCEPNGGGARAVGD